MVMVRVRVRVRILVKVTAIFEGMTRIMVGLDCKQTALKLLMVLTWLSMSAVRREIKAYIRESHL